MANPTRGTAHRLAAALSALLVCLGLVGGATPARAADAPTLKVAIVSEIDSFNPFTTIFASSINILRQQYESLVEYDKDNQVSDGFAEKWTTSPDGKTWTFTVPEGRKWSDGQPATADDVAWTYNQILTNKAMGAANGTLLTNVAKVEATDAKTLVITLKGAQAANPGVEIPIVPKHVWEKVADPAKYLNDAADGPIVGSGPYTIQSYSKGQSVTMKTNPDFHRGAAKIAGITYVYYKNTDAAVQGLKAGEVDLVAGLTPAQFSSLKSASNITTNNGAGRRYQSIDMNPGQKTQAGQAYGNGNPVLADVKVREAIALAVDNKTLIDKVLLGLGKQGVTQVPTVFPDYFGLPAGVTQRTFDPARANQLLDEAGYKKGADGYRTDKTGKPIDLRFWGKSSDPTHAQVADFVVGWLKAVGLKVTVSMKSSGDLNAQTAAGNYDMYLSGWGLGPDPDFQLSINQCSSRATKTDGSGSTAENGWCDPAFDKLFAAQHAELDHAKRADLVKQAWAINYQAVVRDVLYYADSLEAYRSDRYESFTTQPSKGGVITGQSSYWGLYSATPKGGAASSSKGGLSGGAIGGIIAAVLVGGGLAFWLSKRGKNSQDRE